MIGEASSTLIKFGEFTFVIYRENRGILEFLKNFERDEWTHDISKAARFAAYETAYDKAHEKNGYPGVVTMS
jgi:hypothetical protein